MNLYVVREYDSNRRVFCPKVRNFCTHSCICFRRLNPEIEEEIPAYYCMEYDGKILRVDIDPVDNTKIGY